MNACGSCCSVCGATQSYGRHHGLFEWRFEGVHITQPQGFLSRVLNILIVDLRRHCTGLNKLQRLGMTKSFSISKNKGLVKVQVTTISMFVKDRGNILLLVLYVDHLQYSQSFVDNDWVGEIASRRSTTGLMFRLGSSPVSWLSKEQASGLMSSSETKYRSIGYRRHQAHICFAAGFRSISILEDFIR